MIEINTIGGSTIGGTAAPLKHARDIRRAQVVGQGIGASVMPEETLYFLLRSQAEAVQAIAALDPRAAAAHQRLGLLHAERAIAALVDGDTRVAPMSGTAQRPVE